jgi:carbonic anhydrase
MRTKGIFVLWLATLGIFFITASGWSNNIYEGTDKVKRPDIIKKKTKQPPKETSEPPKEAAKEPENPPPFTQSLYRDDKRLNADEALKRLREGNERFVTNRLLGPNRTPERRKATVKGEKPFAVVLTCSDSKVPPELIFDQGIGDLFVIRTAGNVADRVVIGSIEYAVEHLGAKLIMVLGHKSCGAVEAATKTDRAHGEIRTIVDMLRPAIQKAKDRPGDLLENATKANVRLVAEGLIASRPILSELIKEGTLKVVGGLYAPDTGEVEIIYNPCMAGL